MTRRRRLPRRRLRIRGDESGLRLRRDGGRPVALRGGFVAAVRLARGAGDVRPAGRGGDPARRHGGARRCACQPRPGRRRRDQDGSTVAQLLLSGDAVAGAVLASGEEIPAPVVLSSLSRRETLLELGAGGRGRFRRRQASVARRGGRARRSSCWPSRRSRASRRSNRPARFLIAERLESCIAAHAEARAGRLPAELALEAVVPTVFDPSLAPPGMDILSVLVRPLPVSPAEGWAKLAPRLSEAVLAILERHAPGLKANIAGLNLRHAESRLRDPLDMLAHARPAGARASRRRSAGCSCAAKRRSRCRRCRAARRASPRPSRPRI